MRSIRTAIVVLAFSTMLLGIRSAVPLAAAQPRAVPAFPGAEGFGAAATGGRGGKVYVVTTLDPHGPGSLGDALDPEVCEPRTVVFAVSGVIRGAEPIGGHSFDLTCGDLTIAGQTAPGAGITIFSRVFIAEQAKGNIVIRHVRFRAPDAAPGKLAINDPLQINNATRIMLDHISASWGGDETVDMYEGVRDVTVQWSTIEASRSGAHPDGPNHNYALLSGPDTNRITVHHTLFAHHRARCPAMGAGPAELINSVVFDCQDGFVHHNPAAGEFQIVGNTFRRGPNHTEFTPLYFDDEEPGGTTYYLSQNDLDGTVYDSIVGTPWAEAAFTGAEPAAVVAEPTNGGRDSGGYVPVTRHSPAEAFDLVLEHSGAFPRDSFTTQTIDDVRNGTGKWGDIEPDDADGFLAGLSVGTAPADADRDGMADSWEQENGLDPANGGDHTTVRPSGYTALEEYLNALADQLDPVAAASGAAGPNDAATPAESTAPAGTEPAADGAETTAAAAPASEPQGVVDAAPTAPATVPPAVADAAGPIQAAAAAPVVVREETSALSIVALVVAIAALALAVAAFVAVRGARRPS